MKKIKLKSLLEGDEQQGEFDFDDVINPDDIIDPSDFKDPLQRDITKHPSVSRKRRVPTITTARGEDPIMQTGRASSSLWRYIRYLMDVKGLSYDEAAKKAKEVQDRISENEDEKKEEEDVPSQYTGKIGMPSFGSDEVPLVNFFDPNFDEYWRWLRLPKHQGGKGLSFMEADDEIKRLKKGLKDFNESTLGYSHGMVGGELARNNPIEDVPHKDTVYSSPHVVSKEKGNNDKSNDIYNVDEVKEGERFYKYYRWLIDKKKLSPEKAQKIIDNWKNKTKNKNNMKKSDLKEIVKVIVNECMDVMREVEEKDQEQCDEVSGELDEAKKKNKKKKKWLQTAVNPEHKGYCTPMTKSTCTPKRKALAKRFKSGEFKKKKKKTSESVLKEIIQEAITEVAPPGWEGTVKAMKQRHGDEIDNPWALTWWMKNKGYKSHEKSKEEMQQESVIKNKLKEIVKQALSEMTDDEEDEAMDEAAYKVTGDGHQYDHAAEDKARAIQTDPEVNENEASYKTVSPRQARVQKDDHARSVQRQTDMTEHKVQNRSYKTAKDGLQNPENLRDPEVNENIKLKKK